MQLFSSRRFNHGKTTRLAVIFALGLSMVPFISLAQQDIAATEMAKRKAMVEEARELLAKGDEAMNKGVADQAFEAYAGAREMLPDVPALKELRDAATERFIAAALSQSAALANRGDLVGARQMVDRVLAEDVAPEDPSALKMRDMLNDPVRVNPTLTPQHVDDVERVIGLIDKANGAISLGRIDMAGKCYEEILRIDPHNELARRGLEHLATLRADANRAAYDQTRAEMILDVDRAWEIAPPPENDDLPELAEGGADGLSGVEATVEAKLRQITIPVIALDQVSLREAIEFLRIVSAREDLITADQDKRGVNFAINLGSQDSPVVQEIEDKRIDLKLRNVPLIQALKYVNELTGTSYMVDDYAVTIRPRGQVSEEVYMREYDVPPDFISALSEDAASGLQDDPFASQDQNQPLLTQRLSVQELLTRKGVSFGDGASASYSAATNRLRVVNTTRNHEIIMQIVDLIKGADPVIVSVQVTMIKTEQKNLTELGFDWLLNPLELGQGVNMGGGTSSNTPGRNGGDFSQTLPIALPTDATISSGVITNGLRSGDRGFVANSIDSILNNPLRQTQASRVAPGILSLSGIFTDGQVQLMMRGLDQKTGIDMMARPSVITRSGESSNILLAREFIYPTEYDPPELQSGGGGNVGGGNAGPAFPVVPANPTAFETRNVGISLEVLPVAGEDKNFISVMLKPEIVEFDGFVNYGSPITVPVEDALGGFSRVVLTSNEILMPVFSTKRAVTQLTVQDGATVAFGGLLTQGIQSVEDKVPVLGDLPILGRLFRSESNLPTSTAIVFLVRVELMDPTGRRYRDLNTP